MDEKHTLFTSEEIKKITEVSKLVLVGVALVGGGLLVVMLPGVVKIAAPLLTKSANKRERAYQKKKLIQYARSRRAVYYLRDRGFLSIEQKQGEKIVTLTKKGFAYLNLIKREATEIDIDQKWNRKWWLVASDIPTKTHRGKAELFRRKLKSMGFYSLQKSLWIFPFSPVQQINTLGVELDIIRYVTVMEVSKLEIADKQKLLKFFYFLK